MMAPRESTTSRNANRASAHNRKPMLKLVQQKARVRPFRSVCPRGFVPGGPCVEVRAVSGKPSTGGSVATVAGTKGTGLHLCAHGSTGRRKESSHVHEGSGHSSRFPSIQASNGTTLDLSGRLDSPPARLFRPISRDSEAAVAAESGDSRNARGRRGVFDSPEPRNGGFRTRHLPAMKR